MVGLGEGLDSTCREFTDIFVDDISLESYITLKPVFLPHSSGRYQAKRFRKATCPIVERLVCALMRLGRNNGKKLMAVRIVKHTFDLIFLMTGKNPIQVLVDAVQLAGPREDSTRIGSAGVARRQAVDVSPLRRVNIALYLIATGARERSFRSIKTIAETLAEEIIFCSEDDGIKSYAIKKKDEIERVAKANR